MTTLTAGLLLAAAVGCGTDQSGQSQDVTVEGEFGAEPQVTFPSASSPGELSARVASEGDGDPVQQGDLVVADYAAYTWAGSGEAAEPMESTWQLGQPYGFNVTPDMVQQWMIDSIVGQPVGSRVVMVVPPDEMGQQTASSGGDTVFVMDILETYPSGSEVPGEEGFDGGSDLPSVEVASGQRPEVSIPEGDAPGELQVEVLVEGEGPVVEAGQYLVTQYTGVSWQSGEVFDSSWDREGAPTGFPIGVGQVIPGWDEGLVGQPVGSRVLLSIPAAQAYGEDEAAHELGGQDLVFVIDILGAHGEPPEPSASPSASDGAEPSASPEASPSE
ncbi:FKBP-type peptidyl-prolyl cis-trans isomerase [Allonocardiopsis opalescens]|nr:FKBP-type peptidyl-prolyl cis-trans isomerase [Allonocardiopsis opalescens]